MEINKSINNNNNNELRNFLSVEDKMFNEDFLMNKYFNLLFFDDRDSKMLNDKILQLQKHVSLMNLSDIEKTSPNQLKQNRITNIPDYKINTSDIDSPGKNKFTTNRVTDPLNP